MQTIQLPIDEYNKLVGQNKLLQQSELLVKLNEVVEMLYESKFGLYLGDYTEDLTEHNIQNNFVESGSKWDEF